MTTSCDRWGHLKGPDTDDPACSCPMCTTRRADREKKPKRGRARR